MKRVLVRTNTLVLGCYLWVEVPKQYEREPRYIQSRVNEILENLRKDTVELGFRDPRYEVRR